ncbi:Sucrose synthase 5 [Clarias magur]|uniref:Sucrose synthase 5 n=1 Tax=Clarias magur TaxID=1594786 RepID=A0A8J4UKX7_CLAMG|nr:Sucrose synthase 5 [Clarias magur]
MTEKRIQTTCSSVDHLRKESSCKVLNIYGAPVPASRPGSDEAVVCADTQRQRRLTIWLPAGEGLEESKNKEDQEHQRD